VGSAGRRIATIDVGRGPTGLALDAARNRLYAVNKFDGSISVIDVVNNVEIGRVAFFDPTPQAIRDGRPFLYDTHATSGLGHVSCGACHVDGRMDHLAWDLGDPSGTVEVVDQDCNFGINPTCEYGNAVNGFNLFNTFNSDGTVTCVACHALPTGTSHEIISGPNLNQSQSLKVPQLRNTYKKSGFNKSSSSSNRGFGIRHDGREDTV